MRIRNTYRHTPSLQVLASKPALVQVAHAARNVGSKAHPGCWDHPKEQRSEKQKKIAQTPAIRTPPPSPTSLPRETPGTPESWHGWRCRVSRQRCTR